HRRLLGGHHSGRSGGADRAVGHRLHPEPLHAGPVLAIGAAGGTGRLAGVCGRYPDRQRLTAVGAAGGFGAFALLGPGFGGVGDGGVAQMGSTTLAGDLDLALALGGRRLTGSVVVAMRAADAFDEMRAGAVGGRQGIAAGPAKGGVAELEAMADGHALVEDEALAGKAALLPRHLFEIGEEDRKSVV